MTREPLTGGLRPAARRRVRRPGAVVRAAPGALPRGLARLLVPVLVVAGLAACTADAPEPTPTTTSAAPTPTATPTPTPTGPPPSLIATVPAGSVELFADATSPTPTGVVAATDVASVPEVPLTLLVTARDGERLQVLVPTGPPGTTAWVAAGAVTLSSTSLRVEVRLAEHLLGVEDAGRSVLEVPVALGATGVPAPGRYSVTELLQPPAGATAVGALAYGLSGSRPVLEQFAAGGAPDGIHGGALPEELGTTGVGGGVRLLDADVLRLAQEVGLPLGTPVDVVP